MVEQEAVTQSVDDSELREVFSTARDDLKRLVRARLDTRLRGRVDASDVVQEAFLEACRRYQEYLNNPEVPLIEWLRFLTVQSVRGAHRFHLGRQKRSVEKELATSSDQSAVRIVDHLSGSRTSPHSAVVRAELQTAVSRLIDSMSDLDREILYLRHQEQLSNSECAERMGLSTSAASKRYIRAIERLKSLASEYMD